MITPGNFFKAVFGAFESLFWRFLLAIVAVALLFAGIGYWVAHC